MRNTKRIQDVRLSYLCYSHEVKNKETEVIARGKRRKKRPYVTRMCVLHKVIFLILSWVFSGYHILPF